MGNAIFAIFSTRKIVKDLVKLLMLLRDVIYVDEHNITNHDRYLVRKLCVLSKHSSCGHRD